jgi:hypothetical protein
MAPSSPVVVRVLVVLALAAAGCACTSGQCKACVAESGSSSAGCYWCIEVGCYDPHGPPPNNTCPGGIITPGSTILSCDVEGSPPVPGIPWWVFEVIVPIAGVVVFLVGLAICISVVTQSRRRYLAVLTMHRTSQVQQMTSVSQNSNVNAPVLNFSPSINVSPVMNNNGNGGSARNSAAYSEKGPSSPASPSPLPPAWAEL